MSDKSSTPECIRIEFSNGGYAWPNTVKVRCRPYDSDGCWLAVTDILKLLLGKWDGSYEDVFKFINRQFIRKKMMQAWEETSLEPEKEIYAVEVNGWLNFLKSSEATAQFQIDKGVIGVVSERMEEVFNSVAENDIDRVRYISATEHLEQMWASKNSAPAVDGNETASSSSSLNRDGENIDEREKRKHNIAEILNEEKDLAGFPRGYISKERIDIPPLHYIVRPISHTTREENEVMVDEVCFLLVDMLAILRVGWLDLFLKQSILDGSDEYSLIQAPYIDRDSNTVQDSLYIPVSSLRKELSSTYLQDSRFLNRDVDKNGDCRWFFDDLYGRKKRMLLWLSVVELETRVPDMLNEVLYPQNEGSIAIAYQNTTEWRAELGQLSTVLHADCLYTPPAPPRPTRKGATDE